MNYTLSVIEKKKIKLSRLSYKGGMTMFKINMKNVQDGEVTPISLDAIEKVVKQGTGTIVHLKSGDYVWCEQPLDEVQEMLEAAKAALEQKVLFHCNGEQKTVDWKEIKIIKKAHKIYANFSLADVEEIAEQAEITMNDGTTFLTDERKRTIADRYKMARYVWEKSE